MFSAAIMAMRANTHLSTVANPVIFLFCGDASRAPYLFLHLLFSVGFIFLPFLRICGLCATYPSSGCPLNLSVVVPPCHEIADPLCPPF
eukprot:12918023-Prorocentrum_lima.AAC.1